MPGSQESDIGIIEVQVAPDSVARFARQRAEIGPAVGVDEVVEVNRFDAQLGGALFSVDRGSALYPEGREAAAVVEIAVIEVDRRAGAAVAAADQRPVAATDPRHSADRDFLTPRELRRLGAIAFLCQAGSNHEQDRQPATRGCSMQHTCPRR